jgi:hypothetical protein
VTDIFREVEEDVRRERIEKLWKAYGSYAIALLVLLFVGIGAWQLWQRHEDQERVRYADRFIAAQRITNPQAAANAFAEIANTAPKGYAILARLAQASAMFAAGQRNEAIELFKQIAKEDSGTIGSVARLRAGWALADTASRGELDDLLKPLEQPGSAWRENAQEILAYADYRAMDSKSALAKYSELMLDPESPDALRARARAMSAFLKTGGALSYGSMPAEAAPLPPTPADISAPQAGAPSTAPQPQSTASRPPAPAK